MRNLLLLLTICVIWECTVYAQSPRNLTADVVNPNPNFSSVINTENTFNAARRAEEMQLGLPTNSIKNLDLPSQAIWDGYSSDQKMLFLLNDERTSRAAIDYGDGPVKGLPFQGVEAGQDGVSQNYAQVLHDNNAFTHTYNGTTSGSRLSAAIPAGCRESIARSENLYGAGSFDNSFPTIVESAVFLFNYQDGSQGWGHREMNLLQDRDLMGRDWGFDDNNGENGQEGFIGVGIVTGNNRAVLVLNYYDPVADANAGNCPYNMLATTNSLMGGDCQADITISTNTMGNTVASAAIHTQGEITGDAALFSAPTVNIHNGFSVTAGQCFEINNVGCSYGGVLNCSQGGGGGNGTCQSPFTLVCGTPQMGNTSNGTSTWNSYNNGQAAYGGPENIHVLTIPANTPRTITLNSQVDLDIFITTQCNNGMMSYTGEMPGNETVNIPANNNEITYFIIVDGWNSVTGEYTLSCN